MEPTAAFCDNREKNGRKEVTNKESKEKRIRRSRRSTFITM